MRYINGALLIATALAYGVWHHYAAQVYVGDLPPFDLHLYNYEQAQAYLAGLSAEAKALYLKPLHRADWALMLCLTATLLCPVWRRGLLWQAPALVYLGFDLAENTLVSGVLRNGLSDAGELASLSAMTAIKFGALGLAAALAIVSLWRRQGMRG